MRKHSQLITAGTTFDTLHVYHIIYIYHITGLASNMFCKCYCLMFKNRFCISKFHNNFENRFIEDVCAKESKKRLNIKPIDIKQNNHCNNCVEFCRCCMGRKYELEVQGNIKKDNNLPFLCVL